MGSFQKNHIAGLCNFAKSRESLIVFIDMPGRAPLFLPDLGHGAALVAGADQIIQFIEGKCSDILMSVFGKLSKLLHITEDRQAPSRSLGKSR